MRDGWPVAYAAQRGTVTRPAGYRTTARGDPYAAGLRTVRQQLTVRL
ncbi:hypothetical protein [Streptomyces sp. NPDC093544]|jgi:hypothetical protein